MAARHDLTSDTRARIVDAARHLFWEKGYAATGLAELLARAGANSGSFYHFFDGKDALLRTVLETYVDLLEPQVLRSAWASTSDPLERVFALLDRYRERLIATECQFACPIGRLALEIDPENAPAHALMADNFSAWKRAVEASLHAADFAAPDEIATLVLAVMEGGVMQARAYRAIEPFDACVRQLRAYLTPRAPGRRPRPVPARHRRRAR
jgi:TetR/AcrR family transcriptional regulator, transcriptional repressor for nem operon